MVATEAPGRPATGASSTAVTLIVKPKQGGDFEVEWPAEWRIPVAGDMILFPGRPLSKVDRVLWDYGAGTVTVWA